MGKNEGMRIPWYVWGIANSYVAKEGMHGESPGEEIRIASRRSQTMKDPICTAKNFYSILWTIRKLLKF